MSCELLENGLQVILMALCSPFYTWVGGLHNNAVEEVTTDFGAVYGFAIVIVPMIVSVAIINKTSKKRSGRCSQLAGSG